jgi:hypothetical protein
VIGQIAVDFFQRLKPSRDRKNMMCKRMACDCSSYHNFLLLQLQHSLGHKYNNDLENDIVTMIGLEVIALFHFCCFLGVLQLGCAAFVGHAFFCVIRLHLNLQASQIWTPFSVFPWKSPISLQGLHLMLPKEFLRKKGSSQFETTDSGMDRRQF